MAEAATTTTRGKRRGLRRRGLLVAAGVAGPTVVLASTAWACTTIVGSTSVTPTSGAAGSSISASATGLTPVNNYNLKFADTNFLQNDQCMHSTTLNSKLSDASGNVPATSGTIPPGAARGAGEVCFVDAVHTMATDSSTPTTFTVT